MANGKALVKAPINTLQFLAEAIKTPDLQVAHLHECLDFQIKFEAREAEKLFYADFAQASLKMPRITKHGVIDFGNNKGQILFARYEDLDKAIRPIETEFGFSRMFLTAAPPAGKDGIFMTLILAHAGGHKINSERWHPPDPGPGRNGLQAIGSAGSYAKRYLTMDIWNIITGGADDDANSSECITAKQVETINGLLEELNIKNGDPRMGKFLVYAAAKSIEGIQKQNYASVLSRLRTAHEKEVDL